MTSDSVVDERLFRMLHHELIDEFIDRKQVQLPDTFLPSAEYVAVGNFELLWLADPLAARDSARRSRIWANSGRDGSLQTLLQSWFIWVHPLVTGSRKVWFIERQRFMEPKTDREVLVFAQGPTPIVFGDSRQAMALAKYCHPNPGEEAARYIRWVPMAS
jgi:hypothetical protein